MVSPWRQFNVLTILLDHTMNTHFLIQSWLAPPEYQSIHGICCIIDHKILRNLENQHRDEHQLVIWPLPVNQGMITHILAHDGGTEWWLIPPGHPFVRERCSTKDQKTPQHLENRLCHNGKSMFWPFILNQPMNTDFLIQLWQYTLLTDSNWTPFHPWDMSYQEAEGSSTPENRFCHQGESMFWPYILN